MARSTSADSFQSTRPRRARPACARARMSQTPVSIHAPAKGATDDPTNIGGSLGFQSTRPRRARHSGRRPTSSSLMFQSTRPRRARRLSTTSAMTPAACFNPRAREGRDTRMGEEMAGLVVGFNPRAREGRDSNTTAGEREALLFQSTRPRRARLYRPYVG